MWHEARKQEKKIRGMMVDYKRRAERRRDFYERIKLDPAQFLQLHGRPAKIHLDPSVAVAADSPSTMMPWQGNTNNMIDRFDVRAHLDIIPECPAIFEFPKQTSEEILEDRKACYERYRTLVQNDFLGVQEDKFLHQIFLEERFGPVLKPTGEEDKKKLMDKKAAIGYVYEDSTPIDSMQNQVSKSVLDEEVLEEEDEDEEKEDLSDIDLDVTVDVSELTSAQRAEMNDNSRKYGMVDDDFIKYLLHDKEESDQLRLAKEIEVEKAMFSGRKSRRERRALREKKLAGRKILSPPSYAAKDSPTHISHQHSLSKSRSRSRTPPNSGKIMFITSFGDENSEGERSSTKNKEDKIADGSKDSKDNSAKKSSKDCRSGKSSNVDVVIGPHLPEVIKKEEKMSKSLHRSRRSRSESPRSLHHRSKKYSNSYLKSSLARQSSESSSCSRSRSRSRSRKRCSNSSRRDRKTQHRRSSRDRTRSSHSDSPRSRSRSRSRKHSARSHSRSSMSKRSNSPELPPPPVKSYYRHSLSHSSSALSEDSDSGDMKDSSSGIHSLSSSAKPKLLTGKAGPASKTKLTPQERLRRRMQVALNRQYKADKKAQYEKSEKQLQERMDRAEELREMAIKLRQRERERRHKMRGSDSDSGPYRLESSSSTKPEDDDYMYQKQQRSGRASSYSSISSDSSSCKEHHSRPSDVRSSKKRSRSRSYSGSPKRNTWRRSSPAKRSDNSSPRGSPGPVNSQKSRARSPHKNSSSARDVDYRRYQRSRSRSPHHHSSYRRERRSRPSRSSYSSRGLVDY